MEMERAEERTKHLEIHSTDPVMREARLRPRERSPSTGRCRVAFGGDRESKCSSGAMDALRTHRAAMRLHDLFDNRQAEPGALHLRVGGEPVEDFGQHLQW